VDEIREPLPSRVEGLPEASGEALATLEAGLEVLGLAGLPESARRALVDHLRLLEAWTGSINLTAIREPVGAVRLLVLDSLVAVAVVRRRGADALLDLGSGGGFPGLPLAVAVPARRTLLVESVAKKARFLAVAASAVGLADRVEAFAGRAEALAADRRHRERWPVVTARAVGDLAELAELGLPLLAPGGTLIAWKRGDLDEEVGRARTTIDRLGGGGPTFEAADERLDLPGHRLVIIEKVRPTPDGYPRDPAVRRRRPVE
jgi:16S rRNA (guanine527-N7)-methyltransferase